MSSAPHTQQRATIHRAVHSRSRSGVLPSCSMATAKKVRQSQAERRYLKMNAGNHPSAPRHGCHQNNLVLIVHLAHNCSKQLLLSLDPGPEEAGAHPLLRGPSCQAEVQKMKSVPWSLQIKAPRDGCGAGTGGR